MLKNGALFLLMTLIVFSCAKSEKSYVSEDTIKILKLHEAQRGYHFNKDSIAFASQLSDNFISVNKGKITQPKREETISRYHHYFSSVEFIKWDDVTDPVIRFSDDGTLAYTIVDKLVEVLYKGSDDTTTTSETHFAWTAIYRKYGDEWKIDCVTSTNLPKPLGD